MVDFNYFKLSRTLLILELFRCVKLNSLNFTTLHRRSQKEGVRSLFFSKKLMTFFLIVVLNILTT